MSTSDPPPLQTNIPVTCKNFLLGGMENIIVPIENIRPDYYTTKLVQRMSEQNDRRFLWKVLVLVPAYHFRRLENVFLCFHQRPR